MKFRQLSEKLPKINTFSDRNKINPESLIEKIMKKIMKKEKNPGFSFPGRSGISG